MASQKISRSFKDISLSFQPHPVTGDLQVGAGVTVYGNAGIVSATAFYGDGSKLTGVAAAGSGGGALDITSCLFI